MPSRTTADSDLAGIERQKFSDGTTGYNVVAEIDGCKLRVACPTRAAAARLAAALNEASWASITTEGRD